jgi:methionyl-tRNA formyltransferase
MRIIFMGSPEFAVPTLSKLVNYDCEIIAVYTKPPTHSGRGLRENKSVIHNLAEKFSLNVLTPKKLRTPDNIEQLKSLNPDIVIVVAYGLLIPKEFLKIPKYGFVNVHPSDLPRWRGAAPIQRTIMAGDKKTAICIMGMDEGLDTGDIILRKEILLDDEITAKELHDKCSEMGGEMILDVLGLFEKGSVKFTKQPHEGVTYADKIKSEEELINFNATAFEVNNKVRALSPRPGAYFVYKNEIIKIISAKVEKSNQNYLPGTIIDNKLGIACKDGVIRPILLQRHGRKMLYTDAFLRGFTIPVGSNIK